MSRGVAAALVAAAVAGGHAAPLGAQDGAAGAEGVRVEPIVVTATRLPRKLSEVAASVSVVDREEIDLRGPALAGDVLRAVPGIDVQRSGSPGNLENIKIRGGLGTHTLVLVDGFPVNSPTLGEFDIGALPADGFDRIEVVRGAQSALYGSNAIAGVVNLVPREGRDGRQFGVGAAGGSHASLKWRGFAEGGGRAGSFHAGLSGWESDGILPNDGTSLVSFLGSGTAAVGKRHIVHAIVFSTDETKEVPIDFGSPRDPNHVNTRRGLLTGLRWRSEISTALAVAASGAVFDEFFDVNDPADTGQTYGFDSLTKTRKTVFALQAEWRPASFATTIVGAESLRDRGTNDLTDPFGSTRLDRATYNRSLFFQQELRLTRRAGFSLGGRLDRNTEAGTEFNPKAAAYCDIGETGIRVRAAAGRGFRIATLLEKFDPFIGNAALAPEVGHSYEAGFDARFGGGRGSASATWFYQDFRGLIQFAPGSGGPMGFGELRNADRAFSRGAEAGAAFRFVPEAEIVLAYTYSDTWNATAGRAILGIPRQRGVAALLVTPTPGWEGRIEWRVESDQSDAPPNGGDPRRPGYARVDAFGRYRWSAEGAEVREMALTGRIGNLLDRRFEERRGYPAPGFNVLLGLEARI